MIMGRQKDHEPTNAFIPMNSFGRPNCDCQQTYKMDGSRESASHQMANVLEFQGYHHLDENCNQDGGGGGGGGGEGFMFPASVVTTSSSLPWQVPPNIHPLNAVREHDGAIIFPSLPPLPPLPPPPPIPSLHPFYGDIYSRRASSSLQFAYEGGGGIDHLGLAGLYNYMGGVSSSSLPFGGLHAELGKMSAQEIMDAKALAASKSHSEAERRRRERINAHLAKLRSLLPSTTKTDKASLLAEVIQHVKELRRQTSEIAEESPLPTESDELTVDTVTDDEDGRLLVRASLCCEDRPDLLPDLIKALKALRLRTLKADFTTLGGRVRKVLVITGEDDSEENQQQQSIAAIEEALKNVMERPSAAADESSAGGGIKRQRTANLSNILQHSSI